jgi:lysophospholipase L1-like esterase
MGTGRFIGRVVLLLLVALPGPAEAGGWPALDAVATADLELVGAPLSHTAVDTVAAGQHLTIGPCFEAGRWCAASTGAAAGYVDASRITVTRDGVTRPVRDLYADFWAVTLATAGDDEARHAVADRRARIVAWGDSFTAGAGATPGNGYTEQVVRLAGGPMELADEGIGGQSSTAIAGRQGALPITLSLVGGSIAGVGSTPVTAIAIAGIAGVSPLNELGPQALAGALAGVHGRLQRAADGALAFRRDAPGDAATVADGQIFVPDTAITYADRVAWIWAGSNGAAAGRSVSDDIAAMVQHLDNPRYLVASVLPTLGGDTLALAHLRDLNRALAAAFPGHFVDVAGALRGAGNGSAGDDADLAIGLVPRSLRHDDVHLDDAGYAVVAKAFIAAERTMEQQAGAPAVPAR